MTKKAHYEKKFEALREKRKERGRNYDSTEENEFIQADTLLTDLFQIYCSKLGRSRVRSEPLCRMSSGGGTHSVEPTVWGAHK